MLRLLLAVCAAIAVTACAAESRAKHQIATSASPTEQMSTAFTPVEGVYEFVSRTTTVTAPRQSTERLAAPEWYGLWIFHKGYFSQTRMKNIRPDWTPVQFPTNPQGLGFDGASGTYTVRGDSIELRYMVNFYPGRIGAVESLRYNLEGDALTLTWQLVPGPEFGSTGERITVLKRIK